VFGNNRSKLKKLST